MHTAELSRLFTLAAFPTDLVRYYRLLRQYGLNASASGNASNERWITRTGASADDDRDLLVFRNSEKASQDNPIHDYAYPDWGAVLHAHSPYTVSFTLNCENINGLIDLEGKLMFPDGIEIVDDWDAKQLGPILRQNGIVINRGHGVYAAGATPLDAFVKICSLEHSAKIQFLTRR